jgi:very-short-patch-repair endonuclease
VTLHFINSDHPASGIPPFGVDPTGGENIRLCYNAILNYFMSVFNNPNFKKLRQKLRNNMPDAEIILWSELQGKRLNGLKFRRQYGVGPYVVDFYCPKLKLAIEVDGDSHFEEGAEKKDERRQKYIESHGVKFVRCTNTDVYKNLNGVIEDILYEADNIKL